MSDTGYSRGLVKYTSRDYDSVFEDFKKLVPTLTELWTPESDADPGTVLGKYGASIADMLGVNLDSVATEVYAPSVSQRKNAEKVFGLIGYDLGWYTAARTEVTFTNSTTGTTINLDFGFNGNNFSTLNAYTDITDQSRVITYNILPFTNKYGDTESRSRRQLVSGYTNIFADTDPVTLAPGESVTRVAIEGELRSYSVPVSTVKSNNYIITLPSQHIDTTAVWIKGRRSDMTYETTQWIQCASAADFVTPEPRFAVTYDNYSNAQIQVSNYLNQLENYENDYLVIFWIDCSGMLGCVGANVLTNFQPAIIDKDNVNTATVESGDLTVSNLSNTSEFPHTNVVVGDSPETAREAYRNSRKFINTFDSLVTLPDFTRFLNREPGVDCGTVIDCQKALDINLAIYHNEYLTDAQKSKMYITKYDFPEGDAVFDWKSALGLNFNPMDPNQFVFSTNFKRYTAMCFAIHNDFNDSEFGTSRTAEARIYPTTQFLRYKPPIDFVDNVIRDYRPLQAMTVELDFGWVRVFPWYVVGEIYTTRPVSRENAASLVALVKENLQIYFSPANRTLGQKPTVMEVVNVIRNTDLLIDYFDAGSLKNPVINWTNCDIECFNPISFAKYTDPGVSHNNIRVAPSCIVS